MELLLLTTGNKTVFNGSDLGKEYSAKAIQERCILKKEQQPELALHQAKQPSNNTDIHLEQTKAKELILQKTITELFKPESQLNAVPYELLQKKRQKKKNRGLHL